MPDNVKIVPTPMTEVVILAVPRYYPLDVALPEHVLSRHPGYRVAVRGETELTGAEDADAIIVPGYDEPGLPLPEPYLETLRLAGERGARIVTLCTGVFAPAAAGMLAGRTVTTHWQHAAELRALHPGLRVLDDKLLAEDGPFLTSAGATAGIDACLHLIRAGHGAAAADEVARQVIFSPVRAADEPQVTHAPAEERATLRATREWAAARLGEPLTVQRLADHSRQSRRTFIRHFERETGMAPMRWVGLQRLYAARRLLESTDRPIDRVAADAGLGTAANLRGLPPRAGRRAERLPAQPHRP